jgi:hypothetical protein
LVAFDGASAFARLHRDVYRALRDSAIAVVVRGHFGAT